MEQLLILLAVGLIAFVKWLIEKAMKSGNDAADPADESQAPPMRRPLSEPQSEEERMRKFMEALGIPAGSAPPPPVERRLLKKKPPLQKIPPQLVPPIRKVRQPEPEPEFEVDTEPAREEVRRVEKRAVVQPAPAPAPVMAEVVSVAPTLPLAETPVTEVTGKPAEFKMAALLEMLRSPQSVRTAIVLREILGPPRGLQSISSQ